MSIAAKIKLAVTLFVVVVSIIVISSSLYVVNEMEQVVLTQFGKPVGEPIKEAGLHWKTPFIQDVNRMEKRVLEWDGDPNEISTLDKTYIFIDMTARWRIVEPLRFYTSVVTEQGAQSRLDDILDGATQDAIARHDLIESIRVKNRVLPIDKEMRNSDNKVVVRDIKVGRTGIQQEIKVEAEKKLRDFGIELVDVRVKQITYNPTVANKIYDRMISERNRIAEKYRSEGQGKRAEIDGTREKELKKISSDAFRQSEEIRGRADAEAAGIYAKAYNDDPEFYNFLRSLEVLEESLKGDVEVILTTDNDLFRMLKGEMSPKKK